jgi:hypothetical protein
MSGRTEPETFSKSGRLFDEHLMTLELSSSHDRNARLSAARTVEAEG